MLTFPKNRLLQSSLPVRLGLISAANLVRAEGTNEVYIRLNGLYRWITTLDIFNKMGLFSYNVQVISREQLAGLPKGPNITRWPEVEPEREPIYKAPPPPTPTEREPIYKAPPPEITRLVAGRFYRIPGKPEIYRYDIPLPYMMIGMLRHVPDLETFRALGSPPVYEIDQATFDATPKGSPLPSVLEKAPPPPPAPEYGPPAPPPTEIQKIQVTCPQCRSRLEVTLSPIPSGIMLIASMPALCPICGAEVYRDFTKMLRVSAILERKPWPPVTPQVTPPAGWPEAWPEVGIIPYEKFPPVAPPTDYQDVVGLPEGVSVEEKLAYWVEEPALAVAEVPAPWWRRNLLPLAVMGGLGATVAGVAIAKAKKKAKR